MPGPGRPAGGLERYHGPANRKEGRALFYGPAAPQVIA